MPVKRPFRRISFILGAWGVLLSALLLLVSGTARALPEPQAVEDATLVAIVRPDANAPIGYRVEEIFTNKEGVKEGDLLLLPDLHIDIPSEDGAIPPKRASEEDEVPAEPDSGPQQGMEDEDTAASEKSQKATDGEQNPPVVGPIVEPTLAAPPPNAFPEAPIPAPPTFKPPKKSKKTEKNKNGKQKEEDKGKKGDEEKTPQPTLPPVPTPAVPEENSAETPVIPPANTFPEAPLSNPPGDAFPEAPPVELPPALAQPTAAVPGTIEVPGTAADAATQATPMQSAPGSVTSTLIRNVNGLGPDARVLVYLWYSPEGYTYYSVTGKGRALAWVNSVQNVAVLRLEAKQTLAAHREWRQASAITDSKKRLAAIWPFFRGYDRRYSTLAQLQFGSMGVPAGDYIAAHWNLTDNTLRMALLPTLASYHSAALHQRLITHLKAQQRQYETYLAAQAVPIKDRADDWEALPGKMKAVYGEIYYGLVGLTGFKDRSDLPYIRDLARWSLKYRFKQTNDAALAAFKAMPAEANLLLIADTWREYSTRPIPGNELAENDVIAALETHKFPTTVPILALFLRNSKPNVVTAARASLRKIVGRDLGSDPMKWLAWAREKRDKTTTVAKPLNRPRPARTASSPSPDKTVEPKVRTGMVEDADRSPRSRRVMTP